LLYVYDHDLLKMNDHDLLWDEWWSWFIMRWMMIKIYWRCMIKIKIYWRWMIKIYWRCMIKIFHKFYLCWRFLIKIYCAWNKFYYAMKSILQWCVILLELCTWAFRPMCDLTKVSHTDLQWVCAIDVQNW
jgi:hypothetical protein